MSKLNTRWGIILRNSHHFFNFFYHAEYAPSILFIFNYLDNYNRQFVSMRIRHEFCITIQQQQKFCSF